jgi:uncharacterized HAD superfamily protein
MRVAIDLDDVLIEFAAGFIDFHNSVFGTSFQFDEFHSFIFWKVWGGTQEDNIKEIYDYYKSDHFKNIKLVSGAFEAIFKLSKDNELFIITSRNEDTEQLTKEQVHSFFPNMFDEIYFTSNYSLSNKSKSKAMVCDELDIDVFIEDSADNANQSVREGRKVFLFNKPWNINTDIDKRIIRVDSWEEILDML